MGGGVGGTNWELLLVRPVRLNRLECFLIDQQFHNDGDLYSRSFGL